MKRLFVSFTLIAVISVLMTAAVTAQSGSAPFSDHIGHDYQEAIEYLYENEIIDGYPDLTFKPDKQINRAEFLKIIIASNFDKTLYSYYSDENCFPDVPENEWYTGYVCFAKEKGIVEGYPDGEFKPLENINLVEALKIIYEGSDLLINNPNATFKFKYYSPAMLSGYIPDDLVGGYDEIMTRGQISEIIYRVLTDEDRQLESEILLNLDVIKQKYTSSCGNAALAIALSKEIDVTEDEIIEKMVDMGMYPNNPIEQIEEEYVWDDPQKVFVGDYDGLVSVNMKRLSGFGFLETPLERLALEWAENSEKFTGKNLGFIAQQIDAGNPVIVFANVDASDGSVVIEEPGPYTVRWKVKGEDRMIEAPMYKHNLVVEGYSGSAQSPDEFNIVDPFYGQRMQITPYKLSGILEGYSFSGVVVKF
jgi:hypothetical protein